MGNSKLQRTSTRLRIGRRLYFPAHYQILWFTFVALEIFDMSAILGFYFVGVAPITPAQVLRQLIPFAAVLLATVLFLVNHSAIWRGLIVLTVFPVSTLTKQILGQDLSIIAMAWYVALSATAAGLIYLDGFVSLDRTVERIRNLVDTTDRHFAINYCYDECKTYLDKGFTVAMALISTLAVIMTILWAAPDQILPVGKAERLVSSINMVIAFMFLGLELLIWGFRPLRKIMISLRELATTTLVGHA